MIALVHEHGPDWFRDHLDAAKEYLVEGDLRDPLKAIRVTVLQGVRDNFTSSVSPDGIGWPERKHIGDGHPLLIDTGRMMQAAVGNTAESITMFGPRELVLGVMGSVHYAAIHNYGGSRMPQREFMGAQESTLEKVDNVLADAIMIEAFGAT